MKRCPDCRCEKEESEFHKDCVRRDGLDVYCKPCRAGHSRKYNSKNPDANRRSAYKKRYGLSLGSYRQKLLEQGGVCAICGQPELKRELAVDHDHTTGEVRALLCNHCNRGLGAFSDREDLLAAAIDYLRRFTKGAAV